MISYGDWRRTGRQRRSRKTLRKMIRRSKPWLSCRIYRTLHISYSNLHGDFRFSQRVRSLRLLRLRSRVNPPWPDRKLRWVTPCGSVFHELYWRLLGEERVPNTHILSHSPLWSICIDQTRQTKLKTVKNPRPRWSDQACLITHTNAEV